MQNLTDINVIHSLMKKHGFNFSKSLGQNFIIDPEICPQIAEQCSDSAEVGVIEIGPGIGVLTKELATRYKKVVAIELDKRLIPLLAKTLENTTNVTVLQGDVLRFNLNEIIEKEFAGMEVVVCANLPYYITSPVIMKLLEEKVAVSAITVMVQKEAAQRICAPIPSRAVGAVTISIAYYASSRMLFEVAPTSFLPAPKVHSAVIRLDVLQKPPAKVASPTHFFSVVRASFSQRRKTLLNSLSATLALSKVDTAILLEKAGVTATLRAEQLHFEDFAAIANALAEN